MNLRLTLKHSENNKLKYGASMAPVVLEVRVVTRQGGGPDKTILRAAQHISPAQYRLIAAYLHPKHDRGIHQLAAEARRHGCPFYRFAETGAFDRTAIRRLAALCRRKNVAIWHAHDYKSDILGLMLRRFHPMKLVTTVHGFTRETWRTRLYAKLDRAAILGYDRVIAVSPDLLQQCAMYGVNPQRLTYLPNGIEVDKFQRRQRPQVARARLGLDPNRPAIGIISRCSPEKGIDRGLFAFAKLLQIRPDVMLHIVGDGPQLNTLRHYAAQLGINHAIRWWGWQCDTRACLEMMDLLLLPSRTEGFPNVLLEAMAMQVPVAAANVGGVAEVLSHGDAGLLLDPHEPATWCDALKRMLDDAALRSQLSRTALTHVSENYSYPQRIERLIDLYDQVLAHTCTTGQATAPMRQAA